jgi:hypothetical protein
MITYLLKDNGHIIYCYSKNKDGDKYEYGFNALIILSYNI